MMMSEIEQSPGESPGNSPEIVDMMARLRQEAGDDNGGSGGGASAANAELVSYQELLTLSFRPTFDALAPNWQITDEEVSMLAKSYADILDKYFPDSLQAFGAEVTAGLVTVIIFSKRKGIPRKVDAPVDKKEVEGERVD